MAAFLPHGAQAQVRRDMFQIGAQRYLRSQIPLADPTEGHHVAATQGFGVLFYASGPDGIPKTVVRYDAFGTVQYTRVVAEQLDEWVWGQDAVCTPTHDWVAWSTNLGMYAAQVADGNACPIVQLAATYGSVSVATDGARFAALARETFSPCPITVRFFDSQSAEVPGSGSVSGCVGGMTNILWDPQILLRTGAAPLVTYREQQAAAWTRYATRAFTLQPDGTIGPKFTIVPSARSGGMHLMVTDGSIQAFLLDQPGGNGNYVQQRFDSSTGAPLSAMTPIPDDDGAAAISSSGRFIMHRYDAQLSASVFRMFDIDGAPVTDWFAPLPEDELFPQRGVDPFYGRPVALGPDGAIYIFYVESDGAAVIRSSMLVLRPVVPGDLDGDGRLTNFDIDPFVLALTNREAYIAAFPHIPPEAIDILGDMNGDGLLTNFDIDPFVEALVNGP
ncbi:MAG: hypothetical protein HRU75_13040 [Planctomycetia bacterium]|nr:MAG: hypothetical protein HRU75_13040 [Planctomycetia bacterium]